MGMGLFGNLFRKQRTREVIAAAPGEEFIATGRDYYQRAFKRVAKAEGWQLPEKVGAQHGYPLTVSLIPDPENEYDANAVMVCYGSALLGHVPREETTRFHRQFKSASTYELGADARLWRDPKGQWALRVYA